MISNIFRPNGVTFNVPTVIHPKNDLRRLATTSPLESVKSTTRDQWNSDPAYRKGKSVPNHRDKVDAYNLARFVQRNIPYFRPASFLACRNALANCRGSCFLV